MSLPRSLLFNHSCIYAKRGGVVAYHIVWIGLCLRSVLGRSSSTNNCGLNNSDFGKDIKTP